MTITRRALCGALFGTGLGIGLASETALAQPKKKPKAPPPPERIALVGGTWWRHDDEPLEDALIVVDGGLIEYAGAKDDSKIGTAKTIDIQGKAVTAGLVDLLTGVGVVEVDLEKSTVDTSLQVDDPIRAAFRTADGYNPESTVVPVCRRGGLTSVGVVPREGLVPGQSAWADSAGALPADALAQKSLALHIELHDAWYGGFGQSRGTAMLRLRELFDDARAYQKNKGGYDKRQLRELGASRLDYEVVIQALAGKLPCVLHVDRASDIVAALELASENGLRAVLASAAEAWKVADEIAEAGVPAIVYGLDHGPRTFAALGAREDNAALLAEAGVTVALSTGESHHARKLRQVAGNAVRAGLPHRTALDAVTDAPARIMGMEKYGAPKAGRVANLVVWSGDPFELSTRVLQVFIRGRATSLRTRQTALFERYR